jgi:hypothetical protein
MEHAGFSEYGAFPDARVWTSDDERPAGQLLWDLFGGAVSKEPIPSWDPNFKEVVVLLEGPALRVEAFRFLDGTLRPRREAIGTFMSPGRICDVARASAACWNLGFTGDDYRGETIGHWLVRASTPEPPSGALLAATLAMVAAARASRRE